MDEVSLAKEKPEVFLGIENKKFSMKRRLSKKNGN
jgi:hypothetical protein